MYQDNYFLGATTAEIEAAQAQYAYGMQQRAIAEAAELERQQAQYAASMQARADAIAAARAQEAATAAAARQEFTAAAAAAQAQSMEAWRGTAEGHRAQLQDVIATMRGMGYTVILKTPGGV